MKTTVEQRRVIAKCIFFAVFLVFVLVLVQLWVGCAGPVIPEKVEASTIAYDGTEQTAGVLKVWPGRGAILSDTKKAEYDALVELYGRGTVGHPLTPPVAKGRGLTQMRGQDQGFPLHEVVWFIDPQALTDFLLFKEWQRQGRSPL